MKKHYFIFLSVALMAAACPSDSSDAEPDHSELRIVLSDSLEVIEDNDGLRVPEVIRQLSDIFVSESKHCEKNFVLDPSLVRLDQVKDFSLKTKIERGGAKKSTHPKVISKLINKNFDEADIPEVFVKASPPAFRTARQLHSWIDTKAKNDSIIVLSTGESIPKYVLDGKTYPTFSDVGTLREHIQKVLCQNDKANFTVLYNPPVRQTAQGPIVGDPPVDTTLVIADPPKHGGSKGPKPPVIHVVVHRPKPSLDGICDYDTHTLYERVVDANGRAQRGDKVLVMNCKECGY